MNPYLSIYQKDYVPKKAKFIPQVTTPQEFEDPIEESFKHYLELKDESLPDPKENANGYLDKFREHKSKEKVLEIHFEKPLNEEIIEESVDERKVTTYRHDYVYNEGGYQDPFSLIHVKLPDDWPLPETTTGCAYRDPTIIDPDAREPAVQITAINNLGVSASEKFNEILQISTGKSEYEGTIGILGGYIVEKEMHGRINHE